MYPSPVFVVGSPRSGTSVLADALLAVGYSGFREGNFLSLLYSMNELVDRQFAIFDQHNPNVMISHVDPVELKRAIADVLFRITNRLNQNPPWFDKTGNSEMVLLAPILQTIWPSARFIFAKRRAIENVVSRLKKFPAHSFAYHCQDWSRTMASWRSVHPKLCAGSFMEIDQRDLIQRPAELAKTLGDFLGTGPDGIERSRRVFMTNRPQQTAAGTAERILSLAETGWSEDQVNLFMHHCKDEMMCYGYSLEASYYAAPPKANPPDVDAPHAPR